MAVLGNATIWCVVILFVAILLQGTLYFLPAVISLCIAGLVSVLLVSRIDGTSKSKEWYEGD